MGHSFFGDQKGDFSLTIKSISAISVSEDVEFGAGIKDNSDELRTSRVRL